MKGKPFTLFKRGKTYYVRYKLPDGSWSTAKSTKETAAGRAEQIAIKYLNNGNIVTKEASLEKFSKDFFSPGGPWATDLKVSGKRFSERQCLEKTAILNNRILPALGKLKLTATDIQFMNSSLFETIFPLKYGTDRSAPQVQI